MNWHERIKAARERGRFTEEDRTKSTEWFSCACSKLDPRIKKNELGAPTDDALRHLGILFPADVACNNFDAAESILAQIEAREAELLSEGMSQVLTERLVRTRKDHRCFGCETDIPSGSTALYMTGIFDGQFNAYHLCDRCQEALKEWVRCNRWDCFEEGQLKEYWIEPKPEVKG